MKLTEEFKEDIKLNIKIISLVGFVFFILFLLALLNGYMFTDLIIPGDNITYFLFKEGYIWLILELFGLGLIIFMFYICIIIKEILEDKIFKKDKE